MLDSKQRLFVNISHFRDLTSHNKTSGRKALKVLNFSPDLSVSRPEDEEEELRDVCLDRVKDEEEEASEAALFFDQPTPVIEMKSFMSAGLSKDSANRDSERSNQPHDTFSTHSLTVAFDPHLLQSSSYGQHTQQQSCLSVSQSESLSTPVVDPNFAGPHFPSTTHTLANMDSAMYEMPFQTDQTDILFRDPVSAMESASSSYTLQYATPPQFQPQYEMSSGTGPAEQQSVTSHLPESVQEMAHHRPSISSVGQSENSCSSSQPSSPKDSSVPDMKRKRSDSDCGKKGRMTKKQQFDALCNRKTQLEEDNFNLREKVNGYERACKRLKELLYNRIRQQRA